MITRVTPPPFQGDTFRRRSIEDRLTALLARLYRRR